MNDTIELSGYTLLPVSGLERNEISGEFSADSLAQLFINTWVPYYECHKCSRVDYCKFPQPISLGSSRMRDIQCGVVVASVKNFVHAVFPIFRNKINREALQGFLDGAYYFTEFLFSAEIKIGSSMDSAYLAYLGDYAPTFFGRIVHLRDYLNNMSAALQKIPELQTKRGVLFVEGESEEAFVKRLRISGLAWFIDVAVDSYKGKGSRRLSRIEMLLSRYASQGYEIFIQGDADGGTSNIFNNLIQKGLVQSKNTFTFIHDFETAVPHKLALSALKNLGYMNDVSLDDYISALEDDTQPIAPRIRKAFGLNLVEIKVPFAEAVADIVNWSPWSQWTWWKDEDFLKTELGGFLLFIRHVH